MTRRRYRELRQHAARITKLAEYPTHVNGAYLDNPNRIPTLRRQNADKTEA